MHACEYICRGEHLVLSVFLSHAPFESGSLPEPETQQFSKTSRLLSYRDSLVSASLPSARMTEDGIAPSFLSGSRASKLRSSLLHSKRFTN